MKLNFKYNRKAFTLVELLIVIAIIGILFVVLVSKVDFATDKANATGVQTDFRSFQIAFETVSRENAGFNSLGWDTGDKADNSLITGYTYENADKDGGDRIRNSYDKGDMNLNGICEDGETWTGQKLYTETWTGVYTLDNPADATDMSAYLALEKAINRNLDPALQISIDPENKTIYMSNGYQDPWKTEYHGFYLSNAKNDGKDRGAIVMYSDGPNKVFGSEQTIANGIVSVTVKNGGINGQDDLSIITCYTYYNGYGENITTTVGFSNNQSFLANGNSGNVTSNPEEIQTLDAGLYETGSNYTVLLSSWDKLVEDGIIDETGKVVSGKSSSLAGDLVIPSEITTIPEQAFAFCSQLTGVVVQNGTITIEDWAFAFSGAITMARIPDSVTSIGYGTFYNDSNLISVELSKNITEIPSSLFRDCRSLENIVLPDNVTTIGPYAFSNTKIKNINLPNTITSIGEYAFMSCKNLESIVLPDNITILPESVFGSCNSLTTIDIPAGVTEIGKLALYYCNLSTINFKGTKDQWNSITFGLDWRDYGTETIVKCSNGDIEYH